MSIYTQDTYNCWFPDQREPVFEPGNEDTLVTFNEYWSLERSRCINGFHLADGQVYIPGDLYYHTVYWKIAMYEENKLTGKKPRIIKTPYLRDVDWLIFNDLHQCRMQGRFYTLVGSRDWGKSIISASQAGYLYTFFDKSEALVTAGATSFIKLVTDKIEDGLLNQHPIFRKLRLVNDFKKEVVAGWKDKQSNQPDPRSSFSSIKVRNYEMGNKSMAANGTRPGFHLIDEIGTLPNLISCVKDSDGCWWSGDGDKPSALVMLCGTGGDMEVGQDAAEIFYNPTGFNMLEFEDEWEQSGKIGRFIPATMARMKYKIDTPLSKYLGIDHPDLDRVIIKVSDQEACKKEWWDVQHEKAKKAGGRAYIKFLAYWPLKPSQSFLVIKANNFDVTAAKKQKIRLKELGITGTPIEIFYDEQNNLKHKFSERTPIIEYPLKNVDSDYVKGCVVMYEPPIKGAPFGLYIGGVDPYKQDESQSDSLGAVYIFKRMHDILGDKDQNMIVAEYVGRPSTLDEWCEMARNLIKYYNAYTLAENEDIYFIKYMIGKGDGMYLADQPAFIKEEISPNSKVQRTKGIHASVPNIKYLNDCVKTYTEESIREDRDEDGSVTKVWTGMNMIKSPALLEEIIQFNKDGNFDRIRAFSCALAMAKHMDPIIGRVGNQTVELRYKAIYSKEKQEKTIFKDSSSMFRQKKNKSIF